jgi:hypothetical protein
VCRWCRPREESREREVRERLAVLERERWDAIIWRSSGGKASSVGWGRGGGVYWKAERRGEDEKEVEPNREMDAMSTGRCFDIRRE